MRLVCQQPTEDESAGKPAKRRGRRHASSGSSPARLKLVRVETLPEREHLPAGELTLRRERRAETLILWLSGELDCVTSALLERELDATPAGSVDLLVDLTGLESIDSTGASALLQAHQRARISGQRLSFRGPHVAQLLELPHSVQPGFWSMFQRRAATSEHSHFTHATACADVDHDHPQGDRLRGTPDRSPDPAADASGATPLPSAARAAPLRARPLAYDEHPPTITQLPITADNDHPPAA